MKKILFSLLLVGIIVNNANAYPGADYSFTGAPFAIMQQHSFERNEIQNYQNRQRANEEFFNDEFGEQPDAPRKPQTKLQLKNSDTTNYQPKQDTKPQSYDKKSRFEKDDDDNIFIKFWED